MHTRERSIFYLLEPWNKSITEGAISQVHGIFFLNIFFEKLQRSLYPRKKSSEVGIFEFSGKNNLSTFFFQHKIRCAKISLFSLVKFICLTYHLYFHFILAHFWFYWHGLSWELYFDALKDILFLYILFIRTDL